METIRIREAHNLVNNLEEKYNLLQYKVGNWSIWPILRWDFINHLTGQQIIQEKVNWPIANLIKTFVYDTIGIFNLRKAKHLIITKDLNLRERENDHYIDVFFDDILLSLEDFIKVESIHSPSFNYSRDRKKVKSLFTLTFFRKIPTIIPARFSPTNIQETAQRISKVLLPYATIGRFNPNYLRNEFAHFYFSKIFFNWLLEQIQPSFMWLINAHGYPSFVAAAKEKKVKVIELQHGVVYQYHPGYSWNKSASSYKKYMPIPDFFLLYGDFWKEALEENGFWKNELKVVGSPRLDRFRSVIPETSSTVKMVVTTQPLISPSIYCEFFQRFIQLANNLFDFEITFKLHQRDLNKEIYQQSFQNIANVKIFLNNEQPSTFELINNADIHLSIASTCHYEALALGKPTIILPFTNHEAMLPLINQGYGTVCETPEALVALIRGNKIHLIDKQVSEYFFRSNSINNILDFLSSIKPPRE